MNEVLKGFLSMSLSGSLLILLLFFCKRFWKGRLSRQWQYYIWLVVVARLLLPFAPETNFMADVFQTFDRAVYQGEAVQPPQHQPALPDAAQASAAGTIQGSADITQAGTPPGRLALKEAAALLVQNLWLVWAAVALILLVRKITVYQSFVQYVEAGQIPVEDTGLLDGLAVIGEEMGVKRAAELCVNPLVSSPLLSGFIRPCIVLPSKDIPENDFQYIVRHELMHYRRRDMLYKWLVQLTICVHWFNPLVYLMGREINKACEFSCDEAIIAKLDPCNVKAYGKTLLDAMAAAGTYKETIAAVTLSENKELLKERLGAIVKFKKPSKADVCFMALLTICFCFGAFCVGAYASGMDRTASVTVSPDSRPSLALDIRSAAVHAKSAADGKLSAQYNKDVYDVVIDDKTGIWDVKISCKTSYNTNDETILLYLPDVDYGAVDLDIESAYFTTSAIKTGNITGNFNTASVFLTLPESFSGSLDAAVTSGYFELTSRDDFKDTDITVIDNGGYGEVYAPQSFHREGDTFTYSEGTRKNVIRITREGAGVLGVYPSERSKAQQFEPWDASIGWQDAWQDQWGEGWHDSWQGGWQDRRPSDPTETVSLIASDPFQITAG